MSGNQIWQSVTAWYVLPIYQAWMLWNTTQHETASVGFLWLLNPIARKQVLLFFHRIKITPDWRGLRPVYLSMLRNSGYRAFRVLSYIFVQLQWRKPDAAVPSMSYNSVVPSSNKWRSCMRNPFLLKSYSWFLRHTGKHHGISPRFAVEIVTVQSTYNVALDSSRGKLRPLEQDRCHVTLMIFTVSAEALKSDESETKPPIIERLRSVTYLPP